METYSVDYIFPGFREIVKQALKFTSNLAIYLPRNTDIKELVTNLSRVFAQNESELKIEIEQIVYKDKTKVLVVYTGQLARISSNEIAEYMEKRVFDGKL